MAADSRSTHTDALATLGTVITDKEKRDAIHLGVFPVQAGERLWPGTHIGLAPNGKAVSTHDSNKIKAIGIVDPFLQDCVERGDWFWLIVYPRQITSLRHVWEHPDFPDSQETAGANVLTVQNGPATEEQQHKAKLLLGDPVAVAKQKIMDAADNLNVSYDELMENAANYKANGEYWSEGGRFEGESLPHDFWQNYEKVTGENCKDFYGDHFLSCSC